MKKLFIFILVGLFLVGIITAATWGSIGGGDDAEVVLNSPADGATLIETLVSLNATANITGGTLTNMSLWTNETGDWARYNTTVFALNATSYYTLDESSGIVIDSLGVNNGTNNGATPLATGIIGTAYDFEESENDSIYLGTGLAFADQPFSINAWVNIESLTSTNPIIGTGANNGYALYLQSTTGLIAFGKIGADEIVTSSDAITTGSYQMVTIVYNSSGMNFYKNGDGIETIAYSTTFNSSVNYSLGSITDSVFLDGVLDEVGFWNRTLSEAEIDNLYNFGSGERPITSNSIQVWNRTLFDTTLWNVQSCDNDGDCGFAPSNYTFNVNYLVNENSQTYPTTSVELSTETYAVNLTYQSSRFNVITGVLYVNETQYVGTRTGTGDNAIFTANAIMPSVDTSTELDTHWVIGLTNSSGITTVNLTSHNVTVEIINMSLCSETNNASFWNFTVLNETNLVEINSTFEGTFNVKSYGSSVGNEFSFADMTGDNSQFDFCISPNLLNYTVGASIKLTKSGYVDKFYNYQSVVVTNATNEDNLYMMTSDDSTSFIVHTVYVDSTDLTGAEVRVQRYYQGEGEWLTTEILTTNYIGEAVGHLLSEDADYRFLVYVGGELIYTSSATKITCTVSPCTVTLTLPINVPTGTETLADFVSTLTYSDTTNLFTYTYSDTSGNFTSARLYVKRLAPSNATLIEVCNETKTDFSGVITCDISGQLNGTYQATSYLTRSEEVLDKRINAVIGDNIYNAMGLDGVLWAFFLVISISMLGIYRPSMGIIFGTVALISVSLLGIIKIGAMSIIAVSAIAVILLMRIGRE